MTAGLDLLLAALRPDAVRDPEFVLHEGRASDLGTVAELAAEHGVSALLAQRLIDAGIAMEVPGLDRTAQQGRQRSLALVQESVQATRILSDAGIDVCTFKGPTLSSLLYGDCTLRRSNDVDILVQPEQAVRARRFLQDSGYRFWLGTLSPGKERSLLAYSNEYGLWSPAGEIVELTWSLVPGKWGLELSVADAIQDAVAVDVCGHQLVTLQPERYLVALAVHGIKHAWGRLMWIVDVAHLIEREPELQFEWIAKWSVAHHVGRIIHVAVLLSHRLLGSRVPSELESSISTDQRAHRIVQRIVSDLRETQARPSRRIQLSDFLVRDTWSEAGRHLFNTAVTPTIGDWQAKQFSDRWAGLYYAYRPYRLVKKALTGDRS